jgi:hypothetical protein
MPATLRSLEKAKQTASRIEPRLLREVARQRAPTSHRKILRPRRGVACVPAATGVSPGPCIQARAFR